VARTLLSDAERDQLTAALREHYAAGRLDLDELRRRVAVVIEASYLDEAQAALAELPAIAVVSATAPADTPPSRPRRRGHAHADSPQPGWERTNERFRDPASGEVMRVWVDPADGSRHYVPDNEG
jgi:GT2 family glycosyltransferase